ncbi:hypothetical protein Tco_1481248, partial [Tanacetum coccineum]
VGQDNLGSGSASSLVGNFGDSLGVAGGAASRSGGPTRRFGERLAVAGVADPRSVGPAGRSGERLVVAGVANPRSVSPAGRSGERLVLAGVAAPRSGGPTRRSGESLVVVGVADLRNVGPAGSSVGNHGNSLLGQDGVGSRANAMVLGTDGHKGSTRVSSADGPLDLDVSIRLYSPDYQPLLNAYAHRFFRG